MYKLVNMNLCTVLQQSQIFHVFYHMPPVFHQKSPIMYQKSPMMYQKRTAVYLTLRHTRV